MCVCTCAHVSEVERERKRVSGFNLRTVEGMHYFAVATSGSGEEEEDSGGAACSCHTLYGRSTTLFTSWGVRVGVGRGGV